MTDYAYTVELSRAGLAMTEPFVPDLLLDTLKDIGAGIEDEDRGEASCPRIDFSIWATPEAEVYLDGVDNADDIFVAVYEYDAQYPAKRYRRFFGNLVELPRRGRSAEEDVFIFSAVGLLAGYDEVDVIDPVSGGAYRDEYFADLIPALTEAAGHVGGLSVNSGVPIKTADRWTSRLFYPGKHRFGGNYVLTDKITAICNDGTYLYLGVGHWLCRYNPTTRETLKLARLNYTGKKLELRAWEWRIAHIAETGGTIKGWAESVTADLKENAAHAKIGFAWAAGNLISLTDANLIYCHDRGYYVQSRSYIAENRGGPETPPTDFADWQYEQIGEATPASDKTLGITYNKGRLSGTIGVMLPIGSQILRKCTIAPRIPNVDDRVILHDDEWHQDMGKITKIVYAGEGGIIYHDIYVQHKSLYAFPAHTTVFVLPKGYSVSGPNLALPGYRDIEIEYDPTLGIGGATPKSVRVERRRYEEGRTEVYWPEVFGDATEDYGPFVPGPYIALGECNRPEEYDKIPPDPPRRYYQGEAVPSFYVKMNNAAHFANIPPNNYYVTNTKQSNNKDQPGENVLYHNGNPVTITNEGGKILSTRGNIYLSKEGTAVYVAWNRYRWAKGWWFLQICWGQLDGATVKKVGRDRWADNYQSRPPREITGFKVFNGKYYIAVNRIEPRWKNTGMKIISAMPPQTELKPTNYDGGLVATALVKYDKQEYLQSGSVIRVRTSGCDPGDKEYLISEVDTRTIEIVTTEFSSRTYTPEKLTRLVLFALDPFDKTPGAYKAQARKELLDKYITIMNGYDIRGEICYVDGQELKVGHTATAAYGEAFDGDLYNYDQAEWHGETVSPDDYGVTAITELSERRVRPGTVRVTMIADKKEFIVTDMTNSLSGKLPIPPLGEVYMQTREGPDYDETELHFNPAYLGGRTNIFSPEVVITLYLEGQSFNVDYEYYTDRFYVEPFVLDGALYFNETETGAIYRRDHDTGWTRVTAWPAPVAKVDVFGDDVYALAESDYALMRYGRTWPGYINAEVGGADPISVFTALTKIAQAADCFMGEENGRIMFRPREQSASLCRTETAAFENYETLQYLEQKQYRGVLFTYDKGKAYIGQNDPPTDLILTRDAPYVFDYGLAYELARRYYAYFNSGAVVYDVETVRNGLDVPTPAETVDVGPISGRLIAYGLNGPKIGMRIEKTVGGRLRIID